MSEDNPRSDGSETGSGRRTFLGVSALLGAGALGASTTAADDHDEDEPTASVTYDPHVTNGTWTNVTEATLSAGGFVAIHDSTLLDGEVLDSVVGVSEALDAGTHEGIVIHLFDGVPGAEFDRDSLESEETLIAMPHLDTNDNGTYDFVASEGEADGPYTDDAGDPVTADATVSVDTDLEHGEMGDDAEEEMEEEDADDEEMDEEEEMSFSLQDIVDNPEGYYVDNHTAENPDGSIRAQLHGEPGTTEFEVEMTGEAVVEDGTDGARGTAHIVLDPEEEVICFDLSFCDITPPYESPALTATHIHEGDEGDTGPPVICFPDPQPRDPEFDGPRKSVGCLPGELAFQTGV